MLIHINAEQLRKALADIEAAEKNGFMYCLACFDGRPENGTWTEATYMDMSEKAHPSDGTLNWGRGQDVTKRNVFKDGKLTPTKETLERIAGWPENAAVDSGLIEGYQYYVVPGPKHGNGNLNGYVKMPKGMFVEQGYDGIITYVPVHGGITYANEKDGFMIYGFDTMHCNSEDFPIRDKAWIKSECARMIDGLLVAAKVEKKYLTAKKNSSRAKYAQMVLDVDKEQKSGKSFGVMLNILSGKV